MGERLAVRIGRMRVEHGFTQAELAERVGISRVAVSHLESSRTVPVDSRERDMLRAALNGLNLPPAP
jgi:transcriptional regulator with XRE-family HTH domain